MIYHEHNIGEPGANVDHLASARKRVDAARLNPATLRGAEKQIELPPHHILIFTPKAIFVAVASGMFLAIFLSTLAVDTLVSLGWWPGMLF